MKKFYRFFSLLLLSIVGVATAAAQYNEEKMLTSMDEIVGQQVALYSNGTSYGTGYLCGTDKSETITEDALYEFEATGNTSSDGYATYRIKQVSTGKYLKDYDPVTSSDPEPGIYESYTGYTSSVDAAMEFVVAPADDDESASWGTGSQKADYSMIGRGSYSLDCQNYDEGAFCISRAAKYSGLTGDNEWYNGLCIFLCGYRAYAPYPDTNLWCIYSVSAQSGYDKLAAYIESAFPESLNASGYYEGTNPGCIPSAEYAALQEAYQTAKDLYDNTGDSEECEAALEALQAAKAAADAAVITLTDGNYYFIANMRSNQYVYGQDGKMYPGAFNPPTDAASATAAAAKYMWKAISAGDGKFYFQNLYTGTYAGPNTSSSVSTTATLTEQATVAFTLNFVKMNSSNNGIFTIDYTYSGGSYEYNVTGYTTIVHWKDATDAGCQFTFTDATDMAAAVVDQVAQQQLNDQLQAAYDDATELYNRGRVYSSAAAESSTSFAEVDGLVTTVDQLSTNAQESSEGDISYAVDGNWQTHFHSTWSSSSSDGGYHYIQADLGQEVQNLVIKMSKRYLNANNAPTSVRISGTNDVNGTWAIAGTYAFNYDQNLTYTGKASDGATDSTYTVKDYAGYVALELPEAYRYVRMEAITTVNGATGGDGHPFFTFGEIRYYGDAIYDATKSSSFEAVPADIRAELARQIAAGRTELEVQGATQETIDALIAATKAFEAEYPDAAILEEAIEAAQSVSTAYAGAVGTEVGYYSQETYDALTAAIAAAQAAIPTDGSAMEVATIQAHVAALEAAIEALKASVVLPEAGKYYKLLGMTTDSNNSRALNAIVYAKNNDTTSSLLSKEQESESDVDAASALNYLWKLVSINGSTIVLQNVGTGFYMNSQSANGESVTLSPEPVELGIQGISTGGGFNIIVGEGEYLNFAGQRANMVSWSSASGTDNSSVKLVEVNAETDFVGATTWEVTANVNQIITLPIAILNPNDQGEVYTVLGEKETDGVYTLELQTLSDETIPAGMPFIFKPTESGVTEISLGTEAGTIDEIEYATAGLTSENGALTGVIVADTIKTDATVLLKNGAARILTATTDAGDRVADANTGYISYVVTEETGDAQIQLSESMITGIANATIVKTNVPVDVYTISGVRVKAGVKAGNASNGLPAGIYIIGGQKVLVK